METTRIKNRGLNLPVHCTNSFSELLTSKPHSSKLTRLVKFAVAARLGNVVHFKSTVMAVEPISTRIVSTSI
ncbi:hypothetical protein ScPMuIL_013880 [Solemya velum]